MIKKILIVFSLLVVLGVGGLFAIIQTIKKTLPDLNSLKDYQPLLVTNVYDRKNRKVAELYHERRMLVPYEKMPKHLIQAFLAAEDDQFFQHKGVNFQAILRAFIMNLKAGRRVQGGSTITQQVAKTLLLTSEKTMIRKVKDALLAMRMEENLSKEEILYLYLNQIYFGQSSSGVGVAAETYFKKSVEKLTLPEVAILAGLPQAPSRYSPVVNPKRAKERQIYVLHRMADVGFIDKAVAEKAIKEPVRVYIKENYENRAPHYVETVRQLLVKKIGDDVLMNSGLKIYLGLDQEAQNAAQKSIENGLRILDKRQGYRGPFKNIASESEIQEFLKKEKAQLILKRTDARTIEPDGTLTIVNEISSDKIKNLQGQDYLEGVVTEIDDKWGLVTVALPEGVGIIDMDSMTWARKPNPEIRFDLDQIKKPSQALKVGDVIQVAIRGETFQTEKFDKAIGEFKKAQLKKQQKEKIKKPLLTDIEIAKQIGVPLIKGYLHLNLEQEPLVESSLISIDQETQEVIALVGGKNFVESKFNRALQAARQTGSSFKSIVYASALDKGYTPATPIMDAPVVFDEGKSGEDEEGQEKTWKPSNHSKSFAGDILFRNALVKSLNIPTVRIIEDIKVPWAVTYAKRLGIFSPLNLDFTMALGSSSVTLFEMTKVFSEFGRLGKKTYPIVVKKVVDREGKILLSDLTLDMFFESKEKPIEEEFEVKRQEFLTAAQNAETVVAVDPNAVPEVVAQPPQPMPSVEKKPETAATPQIYFQDPDQLIKPSTAYLITSLLKATIEEPGGTGGGARALGREVAGKTGSSNGYYDAWFIGFSPQIATGVWVGFDSERSLGVGEVGGRSALPIWVEYMKQAHENLPEISFPVPKEIVFASIDNNTGKLPDKNSKNIVRQAFLEGTEPTAASNQKEEETDFYKQDLSE
jgi:penicillin-binding protein 1A